MWRKLRWIVARTVGSTAEREQSGQSLVIIAVAFFALLVIVGLAIDLGLMYIERIRLGRACDAAALAGAQELPYEEQAAKRAMQYLDENGYELDELGLTVIGPENVAQLSHPAPPDAQGEFIIRAHAQSDPDFPEPTDLLSVTGTMQVSMSFMVLIGFDKVPVQAHAMAENVLKRLDVAIVYDKSGSMNDDTYCFSCYNEGQPNTNPPPECYGCYAKVEGEDYPAGERMYLPYPNEFCGEQSPVIFGGYEILVAEAEWFSNSTSVEGGANDYHRTTYEEGTTFWMLQRVRRSQASGHRHEEDDRRGAHLMHMPNLERTLGHKDINQAPRLDYNMNLPTPGNWYVWIRAQCGPWPGTAERAEGCLLHWGANNTLMGSISSGDFGPDGDLIGNGCTCDLGPCSCRPPEEGGTRGNMWTWVRLGAVNVSSTQVQINLWGGGTGFRLDKLLLTRNPEGPSNASADRAPSFIRNTTPTWSEARPLAYQSYVYDGRYGGPPDTGGRNGLACDVCNALYGGSQEAGCDKTQDDIFDDAQPIRAAKEAAKVFVRRMRARFDQVAFVEYSTQSDIGRELNCVWQRGVPPVDYGLGVWDPDIGPDQAWIWCFDHRAGPGGYEGPPDDSFDDGSVIYAIESMEPEVWTNIAQGLQNGVEVLQPIQGHHGRPFAARYIVLMTDGVPNRWPDYPRDHECHAEDLWPIEGKEDASRNEDEAKARDCTIYYANQAKNKGIAVFTIGLGVNVDSELLEAVARKAPGTNQPNGDYFPVTSGEELNAAFEEIANRMILRLVE